MPDEVDWYIWRVLTSPKLTVSLRDLQEAWSLDDLMHAHIILDALEQLETRAHGST